MRKYITQIARQSSSARRVTLGRENSEMPIQLLITYAPNNGHTGEHRLQKCGEVKEIMNKECKRRVITWRTDANGQIGRGEEEGKSATKKTPHAT